MTAPVRHFLPMPPFPLCSPPLVSPPPAPGRSESAPPASLSQRPFLADRSLLGPRVAFAQTPGGKFAIIDVRRAISETEQGLRVQATLKKLFDSRQIQLTGSSGSFKRTRSRSTRTTRRGR